MQPNALYYGDCLDWMGRWDDQSVDLIYLDPPFNSQADYNVLYGRAAGGAQYRAFTDTWTWDQDAADRLARYEAAIARPAHAAIVGLRAILGPSGMLAYLTYMAERLEQCHRLLKPTGSLYLHCDPTASHYLKVLLDAVFGHENFRNEIIWQRTKAKGLASTRLPSNHDVLLFYGKTSSTQWHALVTPYNPEILDEKTASKYRHREPDGRLYRLDNLLNPNKDRSNLTYEFLGVTRVWRWTRDRMQAAYDAGLVVQSKPGRVPQLKRYLDEQKGRSLGDIWVDIPPINSQARERLGYPTQKPVALLERLIRASSNPGDLVLDPFCGCGTTIAAARSLDRQWIGIDIDAFAVDLIRERLQDPTIPAYGMPADLASAQKLATERPFAFETWAVRRLTGFVPNTKQVADGGVDGRGTVWEQPEADVTRLALAQVKGGGFSLSTLRDFGHVIDRDRAALGCYLTLDRVDTQAARDETTSMGTIRVGGMDYPRLQRWSMAEYFDQRPPLLPLMADPYTGKPMQMRLV